MSSRALHRILRRLGLQVSRLRDPYVDCARLVGAGSVRNVIDGGAYDGGHAMRMADLFPNATVHLFEPSQATFDRLQSRIAGKPRLKAYRLALSNQTAKSVLHVHETAYTSSILPSTDPTEMREVEAQEIEAVSLDDWLKARSLPAPEVVKLDLQGHELAALRGAEAALASGVRAVIAEVNFRNRYEGGCVFHEVAQLLERHRFRLFRLYEIIIDPNDAVRQADAVFLLVQMFK